MLEIYKLLIRNREKYPLTGFLEDGSTYQIEERNNYPSNEADSICFKVMKTSYEAVYKKEVDIIRIEFIKKDSSDVFISISFSIEKTLKSKIKNDYDWCESIYHFKVDKHNDLTFKYKDFKEFQPLFPLYKDKSNDLKIKEDSLIFVLKHLNKYTPEVNDMFNLKFDSSIKDIPRLESMIHNFNEIFNIITGKKLIANNQVRICH